MNLQPEPYSDNPAVGDELVHGDDDLKAIAKFLDALVQADFALKERSMDAGDD